jgi:hypothetical protein
MPGFTFPPSFFVLVLPLPLPVLVALPAAAVAVPAPLVVLTPGVPPALLTTVAVWLPPTELLDTEASGVKSTSVPLG